MKPNFAQPFFEQHPHLVAFDRRETDEQAELLHASGLQLLNDKLLTCASAEVLDIIAEHNVAAMLIRRGFTDLRYEPPSMSRPIDLIASWEGRTYRVEVKRLASSEPDEFHAKVMKTLNRALETQEQQVIISLEEVAKNLDRSLPESR